MTIAEMTITDPTLAELETAMRGRQVELTAKYPVRRHAANAVPYNVTCPTCGRVSPAGLDIHTGTCAAMLASLVR